LAATLFTKSYLRPITVALAFGGGLAIVSAACAKPGAGAGPLATIAVSLGVAGVTEKCGQPGEPFLNGKSPHRRCDTAIGDTVILTVRDATNDVVSIVKRWRVVDAASEFAKLTEKLDRSLGAGSPFCLLKGQPSARRWQRQGYFITAFSVVSRPEVGLTYDMGALPEEIGCTP
jgi:hypothetical protein